MAQKLYNEEDIKKIANSIRSVGASRLPAGYQELEYIQSTGTQYIDTDYIANQNTIYKFEFEQAEYNGNITLGNQGTGSTNTHRIFLTAGKIYLDIFGSQSRLNKDFTDLLNVYHNWEIGNRYVKDLDTEEYLLQSTKVTDFTAIDNTYICGKASGLSKLKIYGLKIYENETLIKNFIPCYRKSDNSVGIYDIVGKKFYGNSGTGEFVKGEEVQEKYKVREMPEAIENIIEKLKKYIPKATTTELSFKALPLPMEQKIYGNMEQGENPTPERPKEIKTLKSSTGYIKEDMVGINLFDNTNIIGGYFTDNNGNYTTADPGCTMDEFIEVKSGETLYLRFEALEQQCQLSRFFIMEFDENKKGINRNASGIFDTNFLPREVKYTTPKLNEATRYIKLSIYGIKKYEDEAYVILRPAKDYFNDYVKISVSKEYTDVHKPYEKKSNLIYIGDNELLTNDFAEITEQGDTKVTKNWGKYVLNGTESWHLTAETNRNIFYFEIFAMATYTDRTAIPNIRTTHFNSVSQAQTWQHGDISRKTADRVIYIITDKTFTDLDYFKNWLSTNNVELYYELATPIETDLGTHDKLVALEETNNISFDTEIEPSQVETTRYISYDNLEEIIESQARTIQNLEQTIVEVEQAINEQEGVIS